MKRFIGCYLLMLVMGCTTHNSPKELCVDPYLINNIELNILEDNDVLGFLDSFKRIVKVDYPNTEVSIYIDWCVIQNYLRIIKSPELISFEAKLAAESAEAKVPKPIRVESRVDSLAVVLTLYCDTLGAEWSQVGNNFYIKKRYGEKPGGLYLSDSDIK